MSEVLLMGHNSYHAYWELDNYLWIFPCVNRSSTLGYAGYNIPQGPLFQTQSMIMMLRTDYYVGESAIISFDYHMGHLTGKPDNQ